MQFHVGVRRAQAAQVGVAGVGKGDGPTVEHRLRHTRVTQAALGHGYQPQTVLPQQRDDGGRVLPDSVEIDQEFSHAYELVSKRSLGRRDALRHGGASVDLGRPQTDEAGENPPPPRQTPSR